MLGPCRNLLQLRQPLPQPALPACSMRSPHQRTARSPNSMKTTSPAISPRSAMNRPCGLTRAIALPPQAMHRTWRLTIRNLIRPSRTSPNLLCNRAVNRRVSQSASAQPNLRNCMHVPRRPGSLFQPTSVPALLKLRLFAARLRMRSRNCDLPHRRIRRQSRAWPSLQSRPGAPGSFLAGSATIAPDLHELLPAYSTSSTRHFRYSVSGRLSTTGWSGEAPLRSSRRTRRCASTAAEATAPSSSSQPT